MRSFFRRQSTMLSLPSTSNASIELQALHDWEELSAAETFFSIRDRTSTGFLVVMETRVSFIDMLLRVKPWTTFIFWFLGPGIGSSLRLVYRSYASTTSLIFLAVMWLLPCLSRATSTCCLILNAQLIRLQVLRKSLHLLTSIKISSLCLKIKQVVRTGTPQNFSRLCGLL